MYFKHSILKSIVCCLGLVWMVFVGVGVCQAQVSSSAINGTVRDTSGAVIPNAAIKLQNVETGAVRTTKSTSTGMYTLPLLAPGTYILTISKKGFKRASQKDVVLAVNQTLTYNFTLSVGSERQSVTIQATAAQLETSTTELGATIGTRPVNDLPLNGRNFTQLLTLTPGVSPANTSQNSSGGFVRPIGSFSFPSVNGQNNRDNFFILDGINDFSPYMATYAVAPPIDDIAEFKVQSHNDAAFGGSTGGIVNVVTKSGTNQFRGDLWEFLRNNALDARNPFIANVVPYKQNQFGFTLGGPVLLPHYNGRNKTFFFGTYEGFRSRRASTSLYRVPTPAELNGNLSDIPQQIYNPFSTRPDPNNPGQYIRDPFPNNQIPQKLIDPGMVAYAQALFPPPIETGVPGTNGRNAFSQATNQNLWSIRIDEALNEKNSFFFRYSAFDQPLTYPGSFAGAVENIDYSGLNYGVSWTHVFGPSAVLQVEFGHNWLEDLAVSGIPGVSTTGIIQQAGFDQAFGCPFGNSAQFGAPTCQIPGIDISGFVGAGTSWFHSPVSDIYEWRGDFTMVRGSHTLKMGFDLNKSGFAYGGIDNYDSETFSSFQTSSLGASSTGTGSPLASFLLGVPDSAAFRATHTTEHGAGVYSGYVQDQWRTTRKLSVNYGLRWDVTLKPRYGSFADGNLYVGNFDFNTGNYILQALPPPCSEVGAAPCIPGTLPAHVVVAKHQGVIMQNQYNNWGPRLGLAYALTPKTAIRTAFGIMWENWPALTQTAQNWSGTWPSVLQAYGFNLNPTVPTASASDPLNLASQALLPGPTPFNQVEHYVNPRKKNPYSEQWNFGIERQLSSSTLLSVNYVGSHDSQLDIGSMTNVAVTPGPGNPSARAPYPYQVPTYYDTSVGRGSYNALQVSLNKNRGNLGYLIAYTWSKAMDIGCDGYFGVEGCSIENPYNLNNAKSVAGYDLTNMLSASWTYSLPLGYGQRFKTNSHVLNYVVGGWRVNGILTMTSGLPYQVGVPGDIANTGMGGGYLGFYERLNLVGNPTPANQSPSNWLNKSAFEPPPLYTFGTMGRNSLRQDWYRDLDLSIFKDFPVSENTRLEFRAEAFNLTNTPTWGEPTIQYTSPTFGQVTSTRSTEREIQFALKFYF